MWCQERNILKWMVLQTKVVHMPNCFVHIWRREKIGSKSYDTAVQGEFAKTVVQTTAGSSIKEGADVAGGEV